MLRCTRVLTCAALSQYGVLDFLTRVVWLFAFLFAIEGLAYERFGFVSPVSSSVQKRD